MTDPKPLTLEEQAEALQLIEGLSQWDDLPAGDAWLLRRALATIAARDAEVERARRAHTEADAGWREVVAGYAGQLGRVYGALLSAGHAVDGPDHAAAIGRLAEERDAAIERAEKAEGWARRWKKIAKFMWDLLVRPLGDVLHMQSRTIRERDAARERVAVLEGLLRRVHGCLGSEHWARVIKEDIAAALPDPSTDGGS